LCQVGHKILSQSINPIRCEIPAHRMKVPMPIFTDTRQESVTIAMSLERLLKEGLIDHANLYVYPS